MNGNYYNFAALASAREAKYTQEEFAKIIETTVVTLSRMENGKIASYELIVKACQKLNLDSNKIFYSSRKISLVS